jgi:fermentation-respiration switch protein FrsA (DUF1100 family)
VIAAGCGGSNLPTTTEVEPPPDNGNPFANCPQRPLRADRTPVDAPFDAVNVLIDACDGDRIPVALRSKDAQRRPCLVFVAGLGNSITQATQTALSFVGQGYTTLAVEPRYHGTRVEAGITALDAARDPQTLEEMIRLSVSDLRRALDYLIGTGRCERDEVAYVGLSFGGILGSILAGVDDRVGAAVLVVAGGDWRPFVAEAEDQILLPESIDEKDPDRFEEALDLLDPVDPVRWIGRASSPILMINGRDDQIVPEASARALHRAASEPKEISWYDGTHNAFVQPWIDQVTDRMGTFLEDWRSGL